MSNVMRTIAAHKGFSVWMHVNGSLFLTTPQGSFEASSAYGATSKVLDLDIRKELQRQVLATNDVYVAGPEAYEEWEKKQGDVQENLTNEHFDGALMRGVQEECQTDESECNTLKSVNTVPTTGPLLMEKDLIPTETSENPSMQTQIS